MRVLFFATFLLVACQSGYDIKFCAIKDSSVFKLDNSITINEFIHRTDSLKCAGYRIVGNLEESKGAEYIVLPKCKMSNKFIHHDGIQLPIYYCDGFREYGIDICDDKTSSFNKLKEFYINPQRREDFPSIPKNARLKFVIEDSKTIKSILPEIKLIKSMRDRLQNGKLSNLPFIFSLETIRRDSIIIEPPKALELQGVNAR